MEKAPSFGERTAALKKVAMQLREAAEIVLTEAQRMEAAQSRFQQRASKRTTDGASRKR